MSAREPSPRAVLAGALLAAGGFLLALAALCTPAFVARYHFRTPLSSEAVAETARSRLLFGLAALAALALGMGVRRAREGRITVRSTRWTLAFLALVLPLLVLERGARPFVERLTTLLAPDRELGWRNRPRADDTYWGERVRINGDGLRGPERPATKPAGVQRVLVLGDSVVFGLLLTDDEATFPARLERELAAGGARVECLNAGVVGWSPRQERRFLEREGERWQPDLVLLGFVLNDATERAGGGGAAQFAAMRPEGMPAWLAGSGIHLALRELALRRALAGDSPEALAHQRRLTPYHLILEPDSEPVRAAWGKVLPELEGMATWCRAHALRFALVVFPFTLQLRDPSANAPQQILADFARGAALPCLDLLPALADAQRRRGLAETELFFDGLHPTALGNEIAAAETARFLRAHALLP